MSTGAATLLDGDGIGMNGSLLAGMGSVWEATCRRRGQFVCIDYILAVESWFKET
jgi:hypothetical protein